MKSISLVSLRNDLSPKYSIAKRLSLHKNAALLSRHKQQLKPTTNTTKIFYLVEIFISRRSFFSSLFLLSPKGNAFNLRSSLVGCFHVER